MKINTINYNLLGYNQVESFTLRLPNVSRILDFNIDDFGMFSLIYENITDVETRDVSMILVKDNPYNLEIDLPYFGKYTKYKTEIISGPDNFRILNIPTNYFLFLDKSISQIRDEKINSLIK